MIDIEGTVFLFQISCLVLFVAEHDKNNNAFKG